MPRRGFVAKRDVLPDPVYNSKKVTRLINNIMLDGKKGVAQRIVYGAFDIISEKTGKDPLEVFDQAMENVMPQLEVKAVRKGGATYQVPFEVRAERKQTLGLRWLTTYSRARSERTMKERLAGEILDAVNGMGGLDVLKAVVPAQPLDFNVALALVVGSFISAGTLTADFVRFGRNAKLAVLVAMVAFFLGNSLMFIFGAAGAAALGMADISDVMIAQGLLLPAIVVLGLNIWTTNDNALYASGLGFANITGMSSKTLSVINGIIGTVCALWLYNNFVGWLTFLSAAIPPVGGVIIADYLMNRRRYEHFATTRMMSVNWVAILAVALGIAAGHWLPGIVPVNAVLGGALSYLILNPILNRKTTAAMTHVEANSVE